MREFGYLCDEGFSAIVKLTMVKYILPKLRNRWGDDKGRLGGGRRNSTRTSTAAPCAAKSQLRAARATIDKLLDSSSCF